MHGGHSLGESEMSTRTLPELIAPMAAKGMQFIIPPSVQARWKAMGGRSLEPEHPGLRQVEAALVRGGMSRKQARDTIHDLKSGSREAAGTDGNNGMREAAGGTVAGGLREAAAKLKHAFNS